MAGGKRAYRTASGHRCRNPNGSVRGCGCKTGGQCVTISFAGVAFDAPEGGTVDFWLVCGTLTGRQFLVDSDATAFAAADGSGTDCERKADGGASIVAFPGIGIDGGGTLSYGSLEEPTPFTANGCYLSVFRCADGWQIELGVAGNLPGQGAEPKFVIFRGTAPYVASGTTTASNDAAGWTGTAIGGGFDPADDFDIGDGGTATLTIGTTCPRVTDDYLCLCDGVKRSEDCFDLVLVRVESTAGSGVFSYYALLAYQIDAVESVTADSPTDPAYYFSLALAVGTASRYTMPRTDCCSVTGSYSTESGDARVVTVLMAADVEEAHTVLHVTGGDVPINLIRAQPSPGSFIGTAGGYSALAGLDTSGAPTWMLTVTQSGVTKLVATHAFSAGGTSFAASYTVTSSSIPGIAVGDSVSVTT